MENQHLYKKYVQEEEEERRRRSTHHLGRTSSAHVAARCYDYTHTQLFRCWQRKGVFFLFFTTLGRVQLAKMFENSLFFPQLDDKSRRTCNGFFFLGGRGVTDTHLRISLSSFGRCTLFLPVKSLIATAADRKSLTNFLLLASPQSTYTNSKFVIIMIITSSIIFFFQIYVD